MPKHQTYKIAHQTKREENTLWICL